MNNKEVYSQEVIISRQLRRGRGVEYDPIRIITQVFDKKGNLISENDPSPRMEGFMNEFLDIMTAKDNHDFRLKLTYLESDIKKHLGDK